MRKFLIPAIAVAVLFNFSFGQQIFRQPEKVLRGKAMELPTPVYERLPLDAHQEGSVVVEVTIDEQGIVIFARAISGPVLLRRSAEKAAEDSRFKPTLINGVPEKVSGVLTYEFRIKGSTVAPEPETYTPADKSFTLVFPGDPKSVTNVSANSEYAEYINRQMPPETGSLFANLTVIEQVDKGRSYEIWYMDVKDQKTTSMTVDARLREFVDFFSRNWGKRSGEKTVVKHVLDNDFPRYEVYYDLPNYRYLRAQFYLLRNRFYILTVTSDHSSHLRFVEVEQYLKSFLPAP